MKETFKSLTGQGDDVTALVKEMGNLSNKAVRDQRSAGEGTMSDADLKLLSAGVPSASDSDEVWKTWLKTLKRYSKYTQASSEMEGEWLHNVGPALKRTKSGEGPFTVGGHKILDNENYVQFMKRIDSKIYEGLSKVPHTEDTKPELQQADYDAFDSIGQ